MKWSVVFARSAEKEFARFQKNIQVRLAKAIRSLELEPVPPASVRLRGREEMRVRVGDYRILYVINNANKNLRITAIAHRREVYRP